MTSLEHYDEKLSKLRISIADIVLAAVNPLKAVKVSHLLWVKLLAELWPDVRDHRWEAANAARRFYDAERVKHVGETKDTFLNGYDPGDFQDSMEDYKDGISEEYEDTKQDETRWAEKVSAMTLGIQEQIDNGSRLTMLEAVLTDDAAGFARIDPQPPSCSWCVMLQSRGPAYTVSEFKKGDWRWHPGDTCIIVPVFDEDDWPGRDQYQEAERLYKAAAKKDGDTMKNLREMVGH